MVIPPADSAIILGAISQFDREKRYTAEWQGWETKYNFKYALISNGLRYPVKEIIALATGTTKSSFSGGKESNEYLRKLGEL
jgi:5-methylcytosine-specific restriction enzyme A